MLHRRFPLLGLQNATTTTTATTTTSDEQVGRGSAATSSPVLLHEASQATAAALKSWIATRRRRLDPKREFCQADLLGRCNDDKCTKLHARDFEPTGGVSFSFVPFFFVYLFALDEGLLFWNFVVVMVS
jgi:hypothetical protein